MKLPELVLISFCFGDIAQIPKKSRIQEYKHPKSLKILKALKNINFDTSGPPERHT